MKTKEEVEDICDTVAIVSKGEILDIQTIDLIKTGLKLGQKVAIKVNYPNYAAQLVKKDYGIKTNVVASEIILSIPKYRISQITGYLIANNIEIYGVRTIIKTLHELYLSILQNIETKALTFNQDNGDDVWKN